MNKELMLKLMPFIIQAIVFVSGFFVAYKLLEADVKDIKLELAEARVLVIKNDMEHMKDQNNKIEDKVDEIMKYLLTK